jgi:predicted  nucleic acid-binding Zn-ribbon protein
LPLKAISKINDPKLKASMLHKLRKMLNKKETNDTKIPKPTISLSETLERFNKLKSKKVNLEDLQNEVSQIKKEIQQLKSENDKLQDRVSVLELDKKLKLINNNSDSSSEEDDKPESSNKKLIKSDN